MECEENKGSIKVWNETLLKNEEFKGQPQDFVKLHEEIGTLKSTLNKFVGGIESLDKMLRYCRGPLIDLEMDMKERFMFKMRILLLLLWQRWTYDVQMQGSA